MSDTYILDGHTPVRATTLVWAEWMDSNMKDRRVADTLDGDVRVSTVFLGIDHQFGRGPPLLFETLVFGGKLDDEMDRYSTWEQAEKGHKKMCWRAGIHPKAQTA